MPDPATIVMLAAIGFWLWAFCLFLQIIAVVISKRFYDPACLTELERLRRFGL